MNCPSCFKKYAKNGILSEDLFIFVQSKYNHFDPMSLRHIFVLMLLMLFISPAGGQSQPGSNIVSRTVLSSGGTKKAEQHVYDNGLGDIVQEIQSWPGSSVPSLVVRHEYDEYRRRTRSWLPVTSSGSGFVSGSTFASQAQSQYSDSAPFSRTEYDGFLPSQPSAQYKAGTQWQSNGKKVSVIYSESVGAGMYSPEDGYLYTVSAVKYLCTRTVDEDSCWSADES